MIVLGLLLLLASGALTVDLVVKNTDPTTAAAFGQSVSNLTTGRLFLAGVVTGAIAILGLLLIAAGASRRQTRRAGLKRQVRDALGERETLAEENARLQAELDAVDASQQSGTTAYPTDEDATAGRHGDVERPGLFNR
jgi:membrane protein implicated in regulation of membrane protease activity